MLQEDHGSKYLIEHNNIARDAKYDLHLSHG